MEKYESIINMPYQKSTKRKHMSLNDRAAQFAPFAALTGYEESIKEVSRTTDKKIRLSKEEKEIINEKLNFIITTKFKEVVSITYFVKDDKKQGGKYVNVQKEIKRVCDVNKIIYFTDGTNILINDVLSLEF